MPFFRGMSFSEPEGWLFCFRASLGDGGIVLAILTGGRFLFGSWLWPQQLSIGNVLYAAAAGAAITIGFELHAIATGRWAYSGIMPIIPPFGVGLVPLIQMMILPMLSFRLAFRLMWPSRSPGD